MATGPITSWQIEEEKETMIDFFSPWAPKSLWMLTAAMKSKDACSMGKKAMTNLDSVLKSRNITSLTKKCIVKAMDFPVIMVQM